MFAEGKAHPERLRYRICGEPARPAEQWVDNPGGMWSPDGKRIVCLGPDRPHGRIIVVDVVTGDASLVARGSEAIWLGGRSLLVSV
jgi:hypothetical protein